MIPDNIGDFGKSLTNDEARMKLMGAEMTLANIRALCDGSQCLNTEGLRGIIKVIHQTANRTMDKEIQMAVEAFGRIQNIKMQFRDLAKDLMELAGPDPYKEEPCPEEPST
jgi:hypothetical protein